LLLWGIEPGSCQSFKEAPKHYCNKENGDDDLLQWNWDKRKKCGKVRKKGKSKVHPRRGHKGPAGE
jgi:hypothetical protein